MFECLLWRYRSAVDYCRGRRSGCSRPGNGISPLGGLWRSPLTSPQSCQNLHRTGKTDSWRAQTKLCAYQDPEGRSSDPTRDLPRLAQECPGAFSRGIRWWWPAAGLWAPSVAVLGWDLLKEVPIIFITSTTVWPQFKQQGGNTAPPINRKLD